MPIPVLMPALSPTMEEGTLAKWLKKEGDQVSSGDVIAEIETDKATMEVESIDEGTLGKIIVQEGTEGVKVNAPIAVILEDGESAGDIDEASLSGGGQAQPEPKASTEDKAGKGADQAMAAASAGTPASSGSGPVTSEGRSEEAVRSSYGSGGGHAESSVGGGAASGGGGRIKASPLARRIAKQENIPLEALKGTGPHGRIVKRDIEKAMKEGVPQQGASPAQEAAAPQAAPVAGVDERLYPADSYEAVKNDGMRKTIAKRLHQSFNQEVPHFPLNVDIELTELMKLRAKINAASPAKGEEGAYKLSVNDFVIKASAAALKAVPQANATYTDEAILLHKHVDIGVAVAIDGGLITPIVWKAEQKGLKQISAEIKDMAARAKSKKLKPEEYQGGTFSVSNLGMFGITSFSSIVNQPQGAIMSVGAGEERVVVRDGEMVVRTMMTVTLTCDHRVVDGATGAQFLQKFKLFCEDPASMLL
ncbi:pyruvate dehydrogenase complex dihydrolipoamide acetyltransferase [Parvularcula maris]|uniref:Acetyltransferase component of pyruvate dehydrogenase complex n=1 Tax=Parvularcula maris TaxID=2965077 RepID=A0A9X2L7C2_9PROT|nr:pyruvate dehydrogenase complex dihydrolipoamide acetyltransferase [Parvularcula maris]MCQ8184416.1 pyruvate dehydrogenase complex dihydrolipoamide acetyltransferase [Parvularcula maris]